MAETTTYQVKRGATDGVVGSLVLDADGLCFTPKKKKEGGDQEDATTRIPWDRVTKHPSNPPKSAKAMIKIVVSQGGETVTFQLKNRTILGELQDDITKRIKKRNETEAATAPDLDEPDPKVTTAAAEEEEEIKPIDTKQGGDTVASKDSPNLEMREKLLDRREKELTEREKKLEEEQKQVAREKEKLSALLKRLVDVETSIKELLGEGSQQQQQPRSPSPVFLIDTSMHGDILDSSRRSTASGGWGESSTNFDMGMDSSGRASISDAVFYEGMKRSQDLPVDPDKGACYLVYEPDSGGRLMEYYSRTTPIENAIGRWSPGSDKKIAGFKFKAKGKGDVIIGGCSGGGKQGRKNYFSGWCTFLRTACQMQSDELIMWDPPRKGLNVDVWVYTSDNRPGKQSVKLVPGQPIQTEGVLGVAVLPKKTQFYDQAMTIDLDKWLGEGFDLGGSVRI